MGDINTTNHTSHLLLLLDFTSTSASQRGEPITARQKVNLGDKKNKIIIMIIIKLIYFARLT